MMRWFTRDLVPGREALGWFSLCVAVIAFTGETVALWLGGPSPHTWALFGVVGLASLVSWYARGKKMGGPWVLMGGMCVILLLLGLLNP